MQILGIESSCDDTAAALLDCSRQGCFVIKELTASQIEIHKKYGGVVPEIAGRMHAEKIVPLIESVFALSADSATPDKVFKKPDVIAVTAGPGLITGLIVGVEAARTLSYVWKIPLVAVNHIEGHIHSVEINQPRIAFPALALIVSGGHTELVHIKKQGQYKIIGQTRDDAAGECFDKVAKLLDLPYPGGPEISKLAETGNPSAIDFPRPMLRDDNYDFSFAGLKTSALYWLRDNALISSPKSQKLKAVSSHDFCASFEQANIDVLAAKTVRAAQKLQPKTIILAGGVSANKKLRRVLKTELAARGFSDFRLSTLDYCMDNAAMIAVAGYYHALKKDFTSWKKIQADPNWSLD